MKYVYLVYEDWHGLIGIYATPEKATEMVKKDAFESGLPEDTPLDYDDEDSWGWEGATWWKREEVIQ
jgi:hypothetical protein